MATSNPDSHTRRKLALVIGNGTYSEPSNKLKDSLNNADLLSKQLRDIDFEVTKLTDTDSEDLLNAFTALRKKVRNDDLILFYFSGHAYQVNGNNYLIPRDGAEMDTLRDVENFGLNIDANLKRLLEKARPFAVVVILDCNRSYLLRGARGAGCK